MKPKWIVMDEATDPDDSANGANGGGAPATTETKQEQKEPPKQEAKKPEEKGDPEKPEKPAAKGEKPDPEWIKSRLEQHERSLLKRLGVESEDDIKAALQLKREQEEAKKTLEERLASRDTELTTAKERLEAYEEAVKSQADTELSKLSEERQAVVADLAGEDPAKVLQVINRLASTWGTPEVKEPKKPNGSTAAPPGPASKSTSEVDHKAHYEMLRKTNPMAAANYRFAHFREVTGGS